MDRSALKKAKRLVVKVGTSLVTDRDNHVDPEKIRLIVSQIAALINDGREVILVTSGAVGLGLGIVKSSVYPRTLPERQALAALGQSRLMHMYENSFSPWGIRIGQVLLTAADFRARERYENIRNTLFKLLEFKAVPIINENDTVAVEEIKIGDNDSLSANVALAAEADLLVILTDTEGLFDKNPKRFNDAVRIGCVEKMDARIMSLGRGTDSETAIGGMETKLRAARIAASSGIPVVFASGLNPDAMGGILKGLDVGTFFVPSASGLTPRERWIAHAGRKKGSIVIDDGCLEAVLKKGKSILPVGVKSVRGSFEKGDSIRILDLRDGEIGVGLANYGSDELLKIKGQKNREEIVHRDKLVLYES